MTKGQTQSPPRMIMAVTGMILFVNLSRMPEFASTHTAAVSELAVLEGVLSFNRSSPPVVTETVSANANGNAFPPNETIPPSTDDAQRNLVLPGDYIYCQNDDFWDSAPVVVESHKLIFFTIPKVGCTVWKQLFRRMMGYADWQSQDYKTYQPHNPQVNGLTYLYHYSVDEANEMMTSPEWTRAMMVRDPKKRFLSAFLEKSVGNDHQHIISQCCKDKSCVEEAQNVAGFLRLCAVCSDEHWRPQSQRVDSKYWPYINFLGHVETAARDAKQLLQRIGAWEEFGASGWGQGQTSSIFESKASKSTGMEHATHSDNKAWTWYTPETEHQVERFYQGDYENPLFNFTRGKCLTCVV